LAGGVAGGAGVGVLGAVWRLTAGSLLAVVVRFVSELKNNKPAMSTKAAKARGMPQLIALLLLSRTGTRGSGAIRSGSFSKVIISLRKVSWRVNA
jgi:hypothetical protein